MLERQPFGENQEVNTLTIAGRGGSKCRSQKAIDEFVGQGIRRKVPGHAARKYGVGELHRQNLVPRFRSIGMLTRLVMFIEA